MLSVLSDLGAKKKAVAEPARPMPRAASILPAWMPYAIVAVGIGVIGFIIVSGALARKKE